MKVIWCWDDDQETDHAFNVYACEECGRMLKHDVAADKGKTWLNLSYVTVERELVCDDCCRQLLTDAGIRRAREHNDSVLASMGPGVLAVLAHDPPPKTGNILKPPEIQVFYSEEKDLLEITCHCGLVFTAAMPEPGSMICTGLKPRVRSTDIPPAQPSRGQSMTAKEDPE
jgi:hypothetical protein